jgi:hypothetical protein
LGGIAIKQFGGIFDVLRWENKTYKHPRVPFWEVKKGRLLSVIYDLNHGAGSNTQRRTFANIDKFDRDGNGRRRMAEFGIVNLDPGALLKFEIVPQVPPLAVRYDGISDSGEQADNFQKALESDTLPPWRAYCFGVLGVFGISWGWRNDRRVYARILGIILWAWALLIILPWSGRAF